MYNKLGLAKKGTIHGAWGFGDFIECVICTWKGHTFRINNNGTISKATSQDIEIASR